MLSCRYQTVIKMLCALICTFFFFNCLYYKQRVAIYSLNLDNLKLYNYRLPLHTEEKLSISSFLHHFAAIMCTHLNHIETNLMQI